MTWCLCQATFSRNTWRNWAVEFSWSTAQTLRRPGCWKVSDWRCDMWHQADPSMSVARMLPKKANSLTHKFSIARHCFLLGVLSTQHWWFLLHILFIFWHPPVQVLRLWWYHLPPLCPGAGGHVKVVPSKGMPLEKKFTFSRKYI